MKTAFLAIAAMLAGCATAAAVPSGESYRAHGTEPFWSVTIAGGRIVYESPDQPGIDVPARSLRAPHEGLRYGTRRMTVDINPGPCNDGMGDRYYADNVRVIFPGGGRPLEGCGGAVLPPDTLADTGWGMIEIDGAEIARAEDYALQFGEGRIHGQAGCNRFSGPYAQAGAMLTPGSIISTRMACPQPRMTHERGVLRVLSGPVRISFPDGDTLVLTGNGGAIRLRRL